MNEREWYLLVSAAAICYIVASRFVRTDFLVKMQGTCLWQREGKMKECNQCLMTFWSVAHVLYYALLSALCPSLRFHIFILGILWELLEYHVGTYDFLDILWNALGLLIGMQATGQL